MSQDLGSEGGVSDAAELLKHVNATGFPLQLAVEHAVRETEERHRWTVLGREVPWKSREEVGFADLLLSRGRVRIVVECKRLRESRWVFLTDRPDGAASQAWTYWHETTADREQQNWSRMGWHPSTPEAEFCVVVGMNPKSETIDMPAERIGRTLSVAVEALSGAEHGMMRRSGTDYGVNVYLGVLVTTARLFAAAFPPNSVQLSSGTLGADSFAATEVPAVRFSKSLPVAGWPLADGATFPEAIAADRRTMFVVNATHLTTFLRQLQHLDNPAFVNPWRLAPS